MSNCITVIHIEGGAVQAVTSSDPNHKYIVLDADALPGDRNYSEEYDAGIWRENPVVSPALAQQIDAHLAKLGIDA